jgi:hypothetical protein
VYQQNYKMKIENQNKMRWLPLMPVDGGLNHHFIAASQHQRRLRIGC